MQASIVADHDVVEQDVDIGDFVRMEGCDHRICIRQLITVLNNLLQDEAYKIDLRFVEV